MSLSTEMKTQVNEFTGVIRLVNCYIAAHVKENQKKFISAHPETDIKVAQATAKLFAETNKIFYDDTLFELSQAIITVVKRQEKWFPAELHADRITVLTSFGPIDLGGSQQEAINMANIIALSRGAASIPSMGISLAK